MTDEYMEIAGRDLESGRGVAKSDLDWRTYTAALGAGVAGDLFESCDVIGETFTMSGHTFTIVGLLAKPIPARTRRFSCRSQRAAISDSTAITTTSKAGVHKRGGHRAGAHGVSDAAIDAKRRLLHRLQHERAAGNHGRRDETPLDAGGIAAISLGRRASSASRNIMLVSVAERTREIGIRKAIGARRTHILMQFLIEACVLSILGGLIGLGLSALGLRIFEMVADMAIAIEWRAAVVALLFCVMIGVAFGSYPAAKASKLTPIEALQRN
ncbi:MAG: FtsX-like permease family protein [Eubacteriales bacterium]